LLAAATVVTFGLNERSDYAFAFVIHGDAEDGETFRRILLLELN
jgi:hypothetical protein